MASMSVTVTLDKAGRVVIPKTLRDSSVSSLATPWNSNAKVTG